MKNTLLLTIVCLLSFLSANAQELVINGSFEVTGAPGINQISNWTKGGVSGSVDVVSGDAVDGSQCIQINSWSAVIQTGISLQSGKRYKISYYYKAGQGGSAGSYVNLRLAKGSSQYDLGYTATGAWKQATLNVDVTDTGIYTLTISTPWSYNARVDAVSITPVITTPEISISPTNDSNVQINFIGRIETSTDLVTWSALDPQPASPFSTSIMGNKRFWRAVIINP